MQPRFRVSHHDVMLTDTPVALKICLLMQSSDIRAELTFHLRNQSEAVTIQHCDTAEQLATATNFTGTVLFCEHERLAEISVPNMPLVVLGDCNEHAMDAFACGATGFLQRPLDEEKIAACLQHLVEKVRNATIRERFARASGAVTRQAGISREALMAKLNRSLVCPERARRLALRSANAWTWLEYGDVIWIESAGDYLVVHCHSDNHVVRCTLCDMSRKLDEQFIRINRSAIVNARAVKSAEQPVKGTLFLLLYNNVRLKVSRQYVIRSTQFNRWL